MVAVEVIGEAVPEPARLECEEVVRSCLCGCKMRPSAPAMMAKRRIRAGIVECVG